MYQLIKVFWHEPAVALGVLLAAGIVGLKLASGGVMGGQDIADVLAPLAAGVGVRPFVSPVCKAKPADEEISAA